MTRKSVGVAPNPYGRRNASSRATTDATSSSNKRSSQKKSKANTNAFEALRGLADDESGDPMRNKSKTNPKAPKAAPISQQRGQGATAGAGAAPSGGTSQRKPPPALPRIINVAPPKSPPVPPAATKPAAPSPAKSAVPPPPPPQPSPKKTPRALEAITEETGDTISTQPITAQEVLPAVQPPATLPLPPATLPTPKETDDVEPQRSAPFTAPFSLFGNMWEAPSATAATTSAVPTSAAAASVMEQLSSLGLGTVKQYDMFNTGFDFSELRQNTTGIPSGIDPTKYAVRPFHEPPCGLTLLRACQVAAEATLADLCPGMGLYFPSTLDYVATAICYARPHFLASPDWKNTCADYLAAITRAMEGLARKNVERGMALAALQSTFAALQSKIPWAVQCLAAIQALGDAGLSLEDVAKLRQLVEDFEFAFSGLKVKAMLDAECAAVRGGAAPKVLREQVALVVFSCAPAFKSFQDAHMGARSAVMALIDAAATAIDHVVTVDGSSNAPTELRNAANNMHVALVTIGKSSNTLSRVFSAIDTEVKSREVPARALLYPQEMMTANNAWHAEVERKLVVHTLQHPGFLGGGQGYF